MSEITTTVNGKKVKLIDGTTNIMGDTVHDILKEFIQREMVYYYCDPHKRKLFTLEESQHFIHNSTLSIDNYIKKYNLEYKWKRRHIRQHFTYRQERDFQRSDLTLDEYVEKNKLCVNPQINNYEFNENYYDENYDVYDDIQDDDDDSMGWGDDI